MKGLLLTGAGVLILTPDGLLVRLIEADRWTLVFWRSLLMSATLLVYVLTAGRHRAARALQRRPGATLMAAAFLGGSNLCFVLSLTLTTVANTLVVISGAPLVAALASRAFLDEPVARRTWTAIAVCLAGVVLSMSGNLEGPGLAGSACAAGSALCVAGYFTTLRRAMDVDMIAATALGGALAATVAACFATPEAVSPGDLRLLVLLGCVILPLAFGLITAGARYLSAPESALLMLGETVLGPLWVWLALGEDPGWRTLVGGAIVLAALAAHAACALREA